jgi:hypothetical protein
MRSGPDHLHLDCRVESLEERGPGGCGVRCSSGAVFEASLVVGADGVHSLVRHWVTGGDEPVYSGTSGFRGLVPVDLLPRLPDSGALQFWIGPGAHLLHYPIDGGRLINFLAVIDTPGQWTAPGWMEAAPDGAHLKAFAGWHPAVTDMLSAVPQSPRWGLFARRPLARWSRGPAVLLGDAAHAMLPHHGQGANQTIEDAAVLATELDGADDIPAALCRYASRRRARTPQGPAHVVGSVVCAAPARRPGRSAARRLPSPGPAAPSVDPQPRRARPRPRALLEPAPPASRRRRSAKECQTPRPRVLFLVVRPVTDLQRKVAPFEVVTDMVPAGDQPRRSPRSRSGSRRGTRTPCCSARPAPARPRRWPGSPSGCSGRCW